MRENWKEFNSNILKISDICVRFYMKTYQADFFQILGGGSLKSQINIYKMKKLYISESPVFGDAQPEWILRSITTSYFSPL